ncbi:polynucleotide adenylyltransferase [Tulasnella sp. 417]|nr:polynucleotide adenylyltransferase [Tulasnella sp. 417]
MNGPSPKEEALTKYLMEELRRQNTFEDEEKIKNREVVLGRISALVKNFVFTVAKSRGMWDAVARLSGGKIFPFGSYRLGVHGPDDDIDCLLVVPKHVSRDDFFTTFLPMLQETEGVTEVTVRLIVSCAWSTLANVGLVPLPRGPPSATSPLQNTHERLRRSLDPLQGVPGAYVPIIKCKISGVEIDFLCARLGLPSIPDDLELADDNLLKNLDERCVRSLGGPRVTDEILQLVPNVEVFRDALRCIKLWARRRAIYSKVMGFLGGVAWATLVARICQLYPNQAAGAIVSRFFTIMHQWKWPQPVLLKPIGAGPLGVKVWNPKLYPQDRLHRMPIITPAYPSAEVVARIFDKGASWSELFEKHDFFSRYRYYLQVVAATNSAENLKIWSVISSSTVFSFPYSIIRRSGKVESKLRQLVLKLEFVEALKLAHPYVKGIERVAHCINDEEVSGVAFNRISDAVINRTQEEAAQEPGYRTVHTTTFYIGLAIAPKQAGAVGPQKPDVTYPTNEFKRMCKQWELFDVSIMDLHVTHIKNAQLPNWVFEGGVRPVPKPSRRPKPTKTSPTGQSADLPNKRPRSPLTGSSASVAALTAQLMGNASSLIS